MTEESEFDWKDIVDIAVEGGKAVIIGLNRKENRYIFEKIMTHLDSGTRFVHGCEQIFFRSGGRIDLITQMGGIGNRLRGLKLSCISVTNATRARMSKSDWLIVDRAFIANGLNYIFDNAESTSYTDTISR